MEINYEYIANILSGYIGEGIFSVDCEEEIKKFAETKDINVLSQKSCEEINGVFVLTIRPAYQEVYGKYIPNVFVRLENGDQIE